MFREFLQGAEIKLIANATAVSADQGLVGADRGLVGSDRGSVGDGCKPFDPRVSAVGQPTRSWSALTGAWLAPTEPWLGPTKGRSVLTSIRSDAFGAWYKLMPDGLAPPVPRLELPVFGLAVRDVVGTLYRWQVLVGVLKSHSPICRKGTYAIQLITVEIGHHRLQPFHSDMVATQRANSFRN